MKKVIGDTKRLAEDQMTELFDYEAKAFFIDMPHVSPAQVVMDDQLLFGAMMLHFEANELLEKDFKYN